jgi:hypothetical protein
METKHLKFGPHSKQRIEERMGHDAINVIKSFSIYGWYVEWI